VPKSMVLAPGHVKVIKQGVLIHPSTNFLRKSWKTAKVGVLKRRSPEVNENRPSQRANKT
jgi:hypothetical protein